MRPFKGEGMDGRSFHQHRQGSGSDRWHRVDQEAVAIAGDGVLEQHDTRCDESRLEKDVGNACHRLVMRGVMATAISFLSTVIFLRSSFGYLTQSGHSYARRSFRSL